MKTVYQSQHAAPRISLAMTPMIDVVFLLLIFFVCTASFQPVEEVLPSDVVVSGAGSIDAPVEETPELEEIVLRGQFAAGATAWTVNGTPCPTPELPAMLRALADIDRGLPVIVDPDGGVPIGAVIMAYDASRHAGFATVRFAAAVE